MPHQRQAGPTSCATTSASVGTPSGSCTVMDVAWSAASAVVTRRSGATGNATASVWTCSRRVWAGGSARTAVMTAGGVDPVDPADPIPVRGERVRGEGCGAVRRRVPVPVDVEAPESGPKMLPDAPPGLAAATGPGVTGLDAPGEAAPGEDAPGEAEATAVPAEVVNSGTTIASASSMGGCSKPCMACVQFPGAIW